MAFVRYSLQQVQNRCILLPSLAFNVSDGGFPWHDLCKSLHRGYFATLLCLTPPAEGAEGFLWDDLCKFLHNVNRWPGYTVVEKYCQKVQPPQ